VSKILRLIEEAREIQSRIDGLERVPLNDEIVIDRDGLRKRLSRVRAELLALEGID
jgi:hypothetical protein